MMTFDKCKVGLIGPDILSQSEIQASLGKILSEIKREQWFKATYRIHQKPHLQKSDPKIIKKIEQQQLLKLPAPNEFICRIPTPLVPPEESREKNLPPTRIQSFLNNRVNLFHSVDHSFRKCVSYIDIILKMNQPKAKDNMPQCFMQKPSDFANLDVLIEALYATITPLFG